MNSALLAADRQFQRLPETWNSTWVVRAGNTSLIGWGQIRRGVTITPTVDDD